uniref:Carboxypeptidase Q n=1 Tax=Astyanax mexicanus TaxID=7994 RepID=W5JY03_ASTMX
MMTNNFLYLFYFQMTGNSKYSSGMVYVTLLILIILIQGKPLYGSEHKPLGEISKEISHYADIALKIIDLAVFGKAQNRSYERLATFTDTIGNRVSGSKDLDLAIKYMYNALKQDGLENVHLEPVKIPHWVRGEESAVMLLPRNHTMSILGLGSSVGTPKGGIEAEVLVVESFEELKRRATEAKGKIVVYNQPFVSYGETVAYRASGASEAARAGAVASLIRSVTPFSINSPHTGWQWYDPGVPQIPTACITVEDAEMMARMASRGTRIVLRLTMGAQTLPDADSFNTVAEITGSEHPEQQTTVRPIISKRSQLGTAK